MQYACKSRLSSFIISGQNIERECRIYFLSSVICSWTIFFWSGWFILLPERRGRALLNFQIYALIYGNNPYMGKSLRSGAAMPEV